MSATPNCQIDPRKPSALGALRQLLPSKLGYRFREQAKGAPKGSAGPERLRTCGKSNSARPRGCGRYLQKPAPGKSFSHTLFLQPRRPFLPMVTSRVRNAYCQQLLLSSPLFGCIAAHWEFSTLRVQDRGKLGEASGERMQQAGAGFDPGHCERAGHRLSRLVLERGPALDI